MKLSKKGMLPPVFGVILISWFKDDTSQHVNSPIKAARNSGFLCCSWKGGKK